MRSAQTALVELIAETDFNADGSSNAEAIVGALRRRNFVVTRVINQSVVDRFSSLSESLSASYLDLFIYGLEGRPIDQRWLIAKPLN